MKKIVLAATFSAIVCTGAASEVRSPNDAELTHATFLAVRAMVKLVGWQAAYAFLSQGGYKQKNGEIYPFCFRKTDGVVVVGQTTGTDIRLQKDETGYEWGKEMYNRTLYEDIDYVVVDYKGPKPLPAPRTQVKKISYVGTVDKYYVCGVGWYPNIRLQPEPIEE